jgi:hypothetical protein
MIHNTSCHPIEHQISGINYLINRIVTYPIPQYNINKEIHVIDHLLKVNGYHHLNAKELIRRKKQDQHTEKDKNHNQKWANFTYVGKETKFITKLFKDFNINISYRTIKTIENFLNLHKSRSNLYEESGVYEPKFQNCPGGYIGQTGRNFKTRYKSHIQDIRNNKNETGFLHHILNTGHSYNKIENTLKILNIQDKGPYLNTLEKFRIYKTKKTGILLNDNYADIYNPIFELIL